MRILIPIFFNAPMGGLHHHVLASIRALVAAGHEPTVVSKPGPFADAALALGAHHIDTDWSETDLHRVAAAACDVEPDVVYCHPFASRQLGVAVAEALGIPLVAVWHGMYDDFIEQWSGSVARAIAVSDGVAAHLRGRCPDIADRLMIIPNGVDDAWQFQPRVPSNDGKVQIGFVCRLDEDKQFIIDVLAGAVTDAALACREDIVWHIIGDGEGRRALADSLEAAAVHTEIRWHGWLETADMMVAMSACDIIIAPGRSALEAMALGRATVAVGSKHYAGIVSEESWQAIAATNFGGIGSRFDEYEHGRLTRELSGLISDAHTRSELGYFGAQLINERFRDSVSQQMLLRTLTEVVASAREPIADLRAAYSEQRALALRLREDSVLTYRRTRRASQERSARYEKQIAQLTATLARRDETLAAIKRNPLRLITMALHRGTRRDT